jgi:cysteinyl-tRNA synthetase
VNGEKMAKSLGNFVTVRDALAKALGEDIRLLLLKTHYRAPLDFNNGALAEAVQEQDRLYRALQRTQASLADEVPQQVMEALCDDLNTPLAIAHMRTLADAAMAGDAAAGGGLRAAGDVLGLLQGNPHERFQGDARARVVAIGKATFGPFSASGTAVMEPAAPQRQQIDSLISEREAARKARDFARADALREKLKEQGVVVEDTPTGPEWRWA